MAYRFRFYGRSPRHWVSGPDGHAYEVMFAREPSAEEKRALARLVEQQLFSGPAARAGPWLWSRQFAAFDVPERWPDAGTMVFAKVADLLMAAHDIVPIAQVLYWGVRESGDGGWDKWTSAVQAIPSAGPRYHTPRVPPHGRGFDETLPLPAPDADFERSRAETLQAIARQRALAAKTESGLRLVPAHGTYPSLSPLREDPRFDAAPAGSAWDIVAGRVTYGWLTRTASPQPPPALAIVCASGRALLVEGLASGHAGAPAFDRAARSGRVAVGRDLYRIGLDDCHAHKVWTAEVPIVAVDRLGDDAWLVATSDEIMALSDDERPEILARVSYAGASNAVACFGGLGVVGWRAGKRAVDVFGYHRDKFRKLGSLPVALGRPVEVSGELLFFDAGGPLTLAGFDEVYEAWAAPLRAKETAVRAKSKRAQVITLEKSADALTPIRHTRYSHEIDDAAVVGFSAMSKPTAFQSPASFRLLVVDESQEPKPVAWRDRTGDQHTEPFVRLSKVQIAFAPDGESAVAYAHGNDTVLFIDFTSNITRIDVSGGPFGHAVREVHPLGARRVLVVFEGGVQVFADDGDGFGPRKHAEVPKRGAVVLWPDGLGQCVIAVLSGSAKARMVLFDRELNKLAAFAERINAAGLASGMPAVVTTDGECFHVRSQS